MITIPRDASIAIALYCRVYTSNHVDREERFRTLQRFNRVPGIRTGLKTYFWLGCSFQWVASLVRDLAARGSLAETDAEYASIQ